MRKNKKLKSNRKLNMLSNRKINKIRQNRKDKHDKRAINRKN